MDMVGAGTVAGVKQLEVRGMRNVAGDSVRASRTQFSGTNTKDFQEHHSFVHMIATLLLITGVFVTDSLSAA